MGRQLFISTATYLLPRTVRRQIMPRISLTKKFIDQLDIPENIQVFHDTKVTGLQLRVSPKGSKTFYLYFRTKSGKQKRPKLGVYGILTVEQLAFKTYEYTTFATLLQVLLFQMARLSMKLEGFLDMPPSSQHSAMHTLRDLA